MLGQTFLKLTNLLVLSFFSKDKSEFLHLLVRAELSREAILLQKTISNCAAVYNLLGKQYLVAVFSFVAVLTNFEVFQILY